MTVEELQDAIDVAAKGGLSGAVGTAFGFNVRTQRYQPKSGCLTAGYSSGEAVVCSILLCFYLEVHGTPDYVDMPARGKWENSVVDVIWPGAYYFVCATNRLSDQESWAAIKVILPGK
jgi:hypothetical protein